MPICVASGEADRLGRDRHVGAAIDVRVDHLRVVHPVEVITRQYQVVVGVVAHEVSCRLPHGIGRPLEPALAVGCLLGGEDLDESVAEEIHAIRLADMPVERGRIELREHENPAHVRVQAVADRDVNRAGTCQRSEPLAWSEAALTGTAVSPGRHPG